MITPSIRGGHEVCTPVAVEGAEVGDAIAIRIRDIEVTSIATASGNDQPMEGRFNGDPYCAPVCPGCGAEWPRDARRGDRAGGGPLRQLRRRRDAVHVHQRLHDRVRRDAHGRRHRRRARRPRRFAHDAARFAALPDNSVQNPILAFAPHDLVALATRLRPFLGQLGTSPSTTIPDSHNAGDFGSFLSARRTASR